MLKIIGIRVGKTLEDKREFALGLLAQIRNGRVDSSVVLNSKGNMVIQSKVSQLPLSQFTPTEAEQFMIGIEYPNLGIQRVDEEITSKDGTRTYPFYWKVVALEDKKLTDEEKTLEGQKLEPDNEDPRSEKKGKGQ